MAVALRPDLHQAPIMRTSMHENGYAGPGALSASSNSSGTATPAASSAVAPVQRAPDPRGSIEQPGVDAASATVPDLTHQLVTQIEGASTAAQRHEVLQALVAYLRGKEAVLTTNLDQQPVTLEVTYSSERGGNHFADTRQVPADPNSDVLTPNAIVRIVVFHDAFESPSILYSTLRHELIHVAQRLNAPDEEATGTQEDDEFIFEDFEEPLNNDDRVNGNRTAAIKENLQLPLQELEAHAWEILHARETRIADDYFRATIDYMNDYAQKLIHYVRALTQEHDVVAGRLVAYWRGYVCKGLNETQAAYDAILHANGVDNPDERLSWAQIGLVESILRDMVGIRDTLMEDGMEGVIEHGTGTGMQHGMEG